MTTEERISLWSELFSSTFSSFWSSTVTTHPEYWLTWSPLPGEQRRETPRSLLDPTLKVCWQKIIKMFDSRKNFSRVIKSKVTSLAHTVCVMNICACHRLCLFKVFHCTAVLQSIYHFLIDKHWDFLPSPASCSKHLCISYPCPSLFYLSAIPMDRDEAWDLTLGQSVCTFKEIYICYQNI